MRHDRDTGAGDGLDLGADLRSAFQLHGPAAAFLHQAAGVDNGIVDGGLVGHEGHIDYHQCVFRSAGYSAAMMDHVFHGYGEGVFVTQNNITQGIADQDRIDAGLVDQLCGGIIVGGEHGELGALLLCLLECCDGVLHMSCLQWRRGAVCACLLQ